MRSGKHESTQYYSFTLPWSFAVPDGSCAGLACCGEVAKFMSRRGATATAPPSPPGIVGSNTLKETTFCSSNCYGLWMTIISKLLNCYYWRAHMIMVPLRDSWKWECMFFYVSFLLFFMIHFLKKSSRIKININLNLRLFVFVCGFL
jgi:hypothetical protein